MVRDHVVVNLRQPALLGADRAREVAKVVDGQGDIRRQRLSDGLSVLPRFRDGELFEVLLHPVGDPVQQPRPLRRGRRAEGGGSGVRGIQRLVDVGGRASCNLAEHLPGDRGDVVEVLPHCGRGPLTVDVVVVALFEADL